MFPETVTRQDLRTMHFGEGLRQQRERRGISLDDVAISTRISLRHLHALESDRFGELPGGVFNRGIVRSYAQACGLDAEGTVQNFLMAMREHGLSTDLGENDWAEFAEAVHRGRPASMQPRRIRWLGVIAMLLAVAALAAGVLWLLVHRGLVPLPDGPHMRVWRTRLRL
jgi:cytoskeletal protein RodZ